MRKISQVFSGYKYLYHHHAAKPVPVVRSDTNRKNSRQEWEKGRKKSLGNRIGSSPEHNTHKNYGGEVNQCGRMHGGAVEMLCPQVMRNVDDETSYYGNGWGFPFSD